MPRLRGLRTRIIMRPATPRSMAMVRVFALLVACTRLVHAGPQLGEADATSGFADLRGMKIHYVSYGKGDRAVIFVHGWMCDAGFWEGQLRELGPGRRVIAIDLPGHGESDKPRIPYTMQLHAEAVATVMQDAGIAKATLVGHSNGTPVIREFYRKYPEKTEALAIVDGALRPFADKATMEKFIAPLRAEKFHDAVIPLIDGMLRPMKDPAQRERIKAAMLHTPQHVALSEMEAINEPELWRPDSINVPSLVILAKQPAWNADYERFVRELIATVDYQVWPGVSHFLMMERPAQFNAALKSFLSRNDSAPR